MLIPHTRRSRQTRFAKISAKQRGVTLLITLIVLVAMTLAAISLVRSVDTTNVIAGNLAFRQNATLAGDVGTEAAILWLEKNNTATLFVDQPGSGYSAVHTEPITGQTWDQWWAAVAAPRGIATLPVDAAGNIVSYSIERMCSMQIDPIDPGANCSQAQVAVNVGSSQTSQSRGLSSGTQVYYRITTRIDGPRNTVSFTQAVIAL
jgi:Tfp pilus assembly protein PilX